MTEAILHAARRYVQLGISVIPIHRLGEKNEKTPVLREWTTWQNNRADDKQLQKWFGNGSDWRLACVTGTVSQRIAVLDIDNLDLAKRMLEDEEWMADKTVVQTPSGGLHFWFRERRPSGNNTRFFGVGDLRAEHGYVGAPPSEGYKWLQRKPLVWVDNLAEYVKEVILPRFESDIDAKIDFDHGEGGRFTLPDEISEGGRNDTIFRLASMMRGAGMEPGEILASLRVVNRDRCKPPLDDAEIERIAQSASRYDPNAVIEDCTDLGNARRLVARHGRDIKYNDNRGWLVWDGRRWSRDTMRFIQRLAQDTALSIREEVGPETEEQTRMKVLKWAALSQSTNRISAMIAEARPLVAVEESIFDQDSMLLNVANGTLDLRTGVLRDHRRADLITKLANVKWNEKARAPIFQGFLRRILPKKSLRDFVQRALGYGITGDVREQVMFICWGGGQNGKSTLLEGCMNVIGDYGMQAASKLLIVKRQDPHPTDIADLEGARLVVTIEPEKGAQLAEALVKQVTGGDRITARRMYQNNFTFKPTHKIFLGTNYKPVIRGTDEGIWRRIKLIPFGVHIPEEERDKTLDAKLATEYEGMLRWLVQGCLAWQRGGLGDPEEVTTATIDYRQESDIMAPFFEDHCAIGKDEQADASILYHAYVGWATSRGERSMTQTSFGKLLKERGFVPARNKRGQRTWRGVSLRTMKVA